MARRILMVGSCLLLMCYHPASSRVKIHPQARVVVEYDLDFLLGCTFDHTEASWDVPQLEFAELLDQGDFNRSTVDGKVKNDINERLWQTSATNVSVLAIRNSNSFDEGFYTCRTTGRHQQQEEMSSRLYVFPPKGNKSRPLDAGLDPLKSVYVVRPSELFVVPCYPNTTLRLQKKDARRNWSPVLNFASEQDKILTPYVHMLNFSVREAGSYGEYRCSVVNKEEIITGSSFFVSVEESTTRNRSLPVIRPSVKFLVFQARSIFTLKCEIGAGWNITWRMPTSSVDYKEKQFINNASDSFISQLTLERPSSLDTGYYYCYRTDDPRVFVRQFVYIQDWNNLILTPSLRSGTRIIYSQPVVIGCVPTLPSIDVYLYKVESSDKRNRTQVYPYLGPPISTSWQFDIFEGFKMDRALWNMSGEYVCEGKHSISEVSRQKNSFTGTSITSIHSFTIDLIEGIQIKIPRAKPIQGLTFILNCRGRSSDSKSPQILWLWSNSEHRTTVLNESRSQTSGFRIRHSLTDENCSFSQIIWDSILPNANGVYKCQLGEYVSDEYVLNVESARPPVIMASDLGNEDTLQAAAWPTAYFGIIAAIAIVLFILLILLWRMIREIKQRDYQAKLIRQRVLEGRPDLTSLRIPHQNQLESLLCDPEWVFPKNRLKFGKTLGVGHFGIVYQAQVLNFTSENGDMEMTTVAVKVVKQNSDADAVKSLMSELETLIHLGSHMNIVSLLGACTDDIASGNLMIVEEFCRFGNLHNYIKTHKDRFINQLWQVDDLKMKTGRNFYENSMKNSSITHHGQDLEHKVPRKEAGADRWPLQENHLNTRYVIPNENDKDGYMVPIALHARGDDDILSTRVLIDWSFQIANGMGHLTNKTVIHGDLAARNILLTDHHVVKIADFGLSRQMNYKDAIYVKKGEEGLPSKWLAIEALTDNIFSTQSDVWSYGILLWELFSLGKMPYEEIGRVRDLIDYLHEGRRLDKPTLAPNSVGNLMLSCWQLTPTERPSFDHLKKELSDILGIFGKTRLMS